MAVMTAPQSRQSDESAAAFEAFVKYRDMGPSRSTKEVASELSKSHTLIGRWCTAHHWVRRSHSHDAELDRRRRYGELREVEKMRKRQVKAALVMQELGFIELEKMLSEATRRKKKRGSLDEKTILKLIAQGAKQERINRGEPGEIVEQHGGEGMDLTALNLDELKQLRQLRAKVRARQLADETEVAGDGADDD